jgi:hypothetical protein
MLCDAVAAAAVGNVPVERQYCKLKSTIMFFDSTPTCPAAAAAS